jgi:general secretion pathway protein I
MGKPVGRVTAEARAGFTLIEVLVALTIVAFAFVALLGLHNRNLAMVARDQDLTDSLLLARQLITEMEVDEKWPDLGVRQSEYAGFVWERDVEETELPSVRKVHLRVGRDENDPSACELLYYIRDRRVPDENGQLH